MVRREPPRDRPYRADLHGRYARRHRGRRACGGARAGPLVHPLGGGARRPAHVARPRSRPRARAPGGGAARRRCRGPRRRRRALRRPLPGPGRSRDLPPRSAPRDLQHADPGEGRGRPLDPVPGPRDGRGGDPGVRSLSTQPGARGVDTLEERMATEPKPETTLDPNAATKIDPPAALSAPTARRAGLPARTSPPPASDRPPLDVARLVVELAEDKKAADIVLLEIAPFTTVADYLVICSGGSERQLDAIADAVVVGLKHAGLTIVGREGEPASHWVLIDAGARVLRPREALGGCEDGDPGPVTRGLRVPVEGARPDDVLPGAVPAAYALAGAHVGECAGRQPQTRRAARPRSQRPWPEPVIDAPSACVAS